MNLAEDFGTPLIVYDEVAIRNRCREYKSAFEREYPDCQFSYAGKAFICKTICKIMEQEGFHLDVASLGEMMTAISADFPVEEITFHGNNKLQSEIETAIDYNVGCIVVDHFEEINVINRVCKSKNKEIDALIRCTPGVDPHTHKAISTGQADTKFGFNIGDGSAIKAISEVLQSEHINFQGIHCHVGSQLLDAESHQSASQTMVSLLIDIHEKFGVTCKKLNIGGGLGIRYKSEDNPPTVDEFAKIICNIIKSNLSEKGIPLPTLQQEPGRSIIGEAGTTLYRVGAKKTVPILESPGVRHYVSIDGGLSDNPRPQLYDAVYQFVVANKANEEKTETVTLAGRHCETDILIWNARTPNIDIGDIIAVQSTGAYNYSMASNYNRFPKPAVILVNNGNAEVIVRRETIDEVIRLDKIPERFQ